MFGDPGQPAAPLREPRRGGGPGSGPPGAGQALGRDLRADETVEARREGAADPQGVLVGEDREAADDPPLRGDFGQRLGERRGAVRVVRGVEQQVGRALHQLHPPVKLELRRGLADQVRIERPDGSGCCRLGDRHVPPQVLARGAQRNPALGLARHHETGAAVHGGAASELGHVRRYTADDERAVVAEHGQLLGGDRLVGLAEPLGVVEPHRREGGDLGGQHVRRIEAAAEPRLDDAEFDPCACQRDERGCGHDLELRDLVAGLERAIDRRHRLRYPLDGGGEAIGVELFAPHLDPLRPPLGVWREVRAAPAAMRVEQCRAHRGDR